MDLIGTLVKHVSKVYFEDLPQEAVLVAKKSLIDTIGAIIAGSSVDGCRLFVDYAKHCRGEPYATVAVFGCKIWAPLAAQANGAMARAREIDDVSDIRPLHPSASIISSCLAISEHQGATNGKELITGIVLGQDIIMRFSSAITSPVLSGRYNLFKVFACAGAAGKLLRLTEDQIWNAMGIAYSQMPADMQALIDGTMTAYITQGTRARAAVESVLMARKGITGTRNVLQGQYGFFKAFEPNSDLNALISDLGKRFAGVDISVKLYSSCRATHQPIELAQTFAKEGLKVGEIDQITIKCCAECYKLVGQPAEVKRKPRTFVDGNFSIPFTVAVALVKGDVFIDQMSDETVKDPRILEIAQRITCVVDPEREVPGRAVGSVIMEVKTKDGRTLRKETRFPKGSSANPATLDDCITKFLKAAVHSHRPFEKRQLSRIIDIVGDLENLKNVNTLVSLLVPQ
jgi:2-methylcitrate dehydratase PrpD